MRADTAVSFRRQPLRALISGATSHALCAVLAGLLLCAAMATGARAAPAAPQPGIPIVADQRSYAVPGQTGAVQTSLAHDLTAALARATGLPLRMELGLFPQLRQQV